MKAELVVALDVPREARAKKIVDELAGTVRWFKIGSQLFTVAGPRIVRHVLKRGGRVFLDLKYHDIPNTVANAVRAATALGVGMMTLHTAGGRAMLEAAVRASQEEAKRLRVPAPVLLGVTVLTSQGADPEEVTARAREAMSAGCGGVVCSVREVGSLRREVSRTMIIVTPGIRSAQAAPDDQKRTATAAEAVAAGSDFLVVGRPVVGADDPAAAARSLLKEMKN